MGQMRRTMLIVGGAGILIGAGRLLSSRRRRQRRATYPIPASLVIQPIEEAAVTRMADGRFELQLAQPADQVRVYTGPSPDAIDRSQPVAEATHTDHLILNVAGDMARPYFEIMRDQQPPLLIAERILPLEGIANVRDIGGYRTEDGLRVRWGLVYRTGSLAAATDADLQLLTDLNIRLVCDLRTVDEVISGPDRLPVNMAPVYRHLPVDTGAQTSRQMRAVLLNPSNLQAVMDEAYTYHMIEQNGAVIGETLAALANPVNLPVIIHCTAGKDRTGIIIALLLALLGVPDETILADYSLSNYYFAAFRDYIASKFKQPQAFLMGIQVDDLQPLLTANPETMRRTLVYVRENYGSVEHYLAQKADIDAATVAKIRDNLLV